MSHVSTSTATNAASAADRKLHVSDSNFPSTTRFAVSASCRYTYICCTNNNLLAAFSCRLQKSHPSCFGWHGPLVAIGLPDCFYVPQAVTWWSSKTNLKKCAHLSIACSCTNWLIMTINLSHCWLGTILLCCRHRDKMIHLPRESKSYWGTFPSCRGCLSTAQLIDFGISNPGKVLH